MTVSVCACAADAHAPRASAMTRRCDRGRAGVPSSRSPWTGIPSLAPRGAVASTFAFSSRMQNCRHRWSRRRSATTDSRARVRRLARLRPSRQFASSSIRSSPLRNAPSSRGSTVSADIAGDFGQRGHVRGQHRHAARHRFEHRQAESFVQRRKRESVRAGIDRRQIVLADVAETARRARSLRAARSRVRARR